MHVVDDGASLGQKRPPAPDDLGGNAVWVATVGLMCCGCHESGENESQERERESLKLFHGLSYSHPPWGLLEIQSCSWRRKEENNCMQLHSLVFSMLPHLHLKSSPPLRLRCSLPLSGTSLWTQIVADRIII